MGGWVGLWVFECFVWWVGKFVKCLPEYVNCCVVGEMVDLLLVMRCVCQETES